MISKIQFDRAYNTYPPNWWIKTVFRYFSEETDKTDLIPKKAIIWILLTLFLSGFISTIIRANPQFTKIVTILYAIILLSLIAFLLVGAIMNTHRLSKIIKLLGISKVEYNELVDKFYGSI